MSKQHRALMWADKLDMTFSATSLPKGWRFDVSEELHAQHELIQKLKAALAMALPAVEHFKFLEDGAYGKNFSEFRSIKAHSDLRYVKEALAAAEAHK